MIAINKDLVAPIAAGVVGVIVLTLFFKQQAKDAAAAISEINEGTPFEGTGVIGTIGNVTDQASGGLLSRAGSAIGEFFSGSFFDRRTVDDLTNPNG